MDARGRTVQGLGGGLLAALSYGLIQLVFEQRLWPRAVALVSGMWGVATLCGAAAGGLFAQAGHWRWAFWFLLPVAAAQALLVLVQLRPSMGVKHARPAVPPRVPGMQIGLLALSVLVIAASGLWPELLWQAVGVALGLAIGFAATRIDSRATVRVLPSGAYSMSAPLGAIYASVALLLIGSTTEIFVPYFCSCCTATRRWQRAISPPRWRAAGARARCCPRAAAARGPTACCAPAR